MRLTAAAEKKGKHMEFPTFAERVTEDGIRMIVQNIGRFRVKDGSYSDQWSCTLAFPDGESDLFWINTGQTVRIMSGVIWGGEVSKQGREMHPEIEDVVHVLCREAADVENYPDYDDWLNNWLGGNVPETFKEYREMRATFEKHRITWRKLRTFLGGKFKEYIDKTEWQ